MNRRERRARAKADEAARRHDVQKRAAAILAAEAEPEPVEETVEPEPEPTIEQKLEAAEQQIRELQAEAGKYRDALIDVASEREALRNGAPPDINAWMLGVELRTASTVEVVDLVAGPRRVDVRFAPRHSNGEPMLVADADNRGFQRQATPSEWFQAELAKPDRAPMAQALLWHPGYRPPALGTNAHGVPFVRQSVHNYRPPQSEE